MKVTWAVLCLSAMIMSGCATVAMEDEAKSRAALEFKPPPAGKSGLYIFRDSTLGAALKKTLWVDEKCIGETAPNVFFYLEVDGDKAHEIAVESEFSPNKKQIKTDAGKHHYVRQYIKLGVFVGGTNVEEVSEEEGKAALAPLRMAAQRDCGKLSPPKDQ